VEVTRRREVAAGEFLDVLQDHFSKTFESHPASLLYAAAWLAGASLFRSFRFPHLPPAGSVVLSDKANDEGLRLLETYFSTLLEKYRIKVATADIIYDIPQEYKPVKDILAVQKLLQHAFVTIIKRQGLDDVQAAEAGALVCALLTEHYCILNKDLAINLATGIVCMGFVEGTKTSPLPL
jgi:hypothetical protein